MRQSLPLQVVHRTHDCLEHFARLRFREGRPAKRRGQRLVGILKHRVEYRVTRELDASAIQQGAQIRML